MEPSRVGFNARFKDAALERTYNREFFLTWKRMFRATVVFLTLFNVSIAVLYCALVVPTDYVFVSVVFGDRVALGDALAYATVFTPLFTLLLTGALYTRLYTEHTHVHMLGLASLGTLLAFGWPVSGPVGERAAHYKLAFANQDAWQEIHRRINIVFPQSLGRSSQEDFEKDLGMDLQAFFGPRV